MPANTSEYQHVEEHGYKAGGAKVSRAFDGNEKLGANLSGRKQGRFESLY